MGKKSWTEEEENIIREFYPTEGKEIAARLKGHSLAAIRLRASKLGIRCTDSLTCNLWTDEENEILIKYYPAEDEAVLKRLPNKDKHQLINHVYYLGLYGKYHKKKFEVVKWSREEDSIIREYYPKEGFDIIKRLPGRTRNAIKTRASQLGIKCTGSGRKCWNDDEILILRNYYETEGSKGVYDRLDKRFTRTEISLKANRMGLKNPRIKKESVTFTPEETRIIIDCYEEEGAAGVRERIGKRHSIRNINRKANALGIHRK